MSDKRKIGATPAGESGDTTEEEMSPELARIIADYQAELAELYENRRRRAAARANMTEEELIASMVADLEAVYADAEENGMDIVVIGDGDDDE